MKKSALKILEVVSLVAGVGLFVYLIKQTGARALGDHLSSLGWGFAIIVALSAARNLVRAAAWFYSMEPEHRRLGFWSVTNVMLAGEAIKYLTATGPLLGEPAKAAMVRRQVPMVEGFSSVVVENLTYSLSAILVMLAGLPALALLADVPGHFKTAGYGLAAGVVIATAVVWMSIRFRWFVIARLLERVAKLTASNRGEAARSKPRRADAMIARARAVEENIYSFYRERRGAFLLIFALDMLAHLINVVEIYAILSMMGLESSLAIGFVIEAVTKTINMVFFFVPTRAGVYEGGHEMVTRALGLSSSAGVALAIIRKLRAFVWAGYGLVVLGLMTFRDRREVKRASEQAQRAET
jgi:hypothetical protein